MSNKIPQAKIPTIEDILESIPFGKDRKLFNKMEIQLLLGLKIGKSQMLTLEDREFLYEVINMFYQYKKKEDGEVKAKGKRVKEGDIVIEEIEVKESEVKNGFKLVYDFLNQDWKSRFPGNDYAVRKGIIFMNPLLEESRKRNLIDMDILKNQVVAQTGVYKCTKCGSKETVAVEKQVRSADEPATVIVTCVHCKHAHRVQ